MKFPYIALLDLGLDQKLLVAETVNLPKSADVTRWRGGWAGEWRLCQQSICFSGFPPPRRRNEIIAFSGPEFDQKRGQGH